jgi:phage-related protein
MAVAGRDAIVPANGAGALGSAQHPAGKSHRRVFFCAHQETLVTLHGLIKKTPKTPAADLKLTRKRMREVKE